MNRRDFLAAGFKIGAAGLLLPVIKPARKVWALDRTMIPQSVYTSGWFDASMPGLDKAFYGIAHTTYDPTHMIGVEFTHGNWYKCETESGAFTRDTVYYSIPTKEYFVWTGSHFAWIGGATPLV